MTLLAEGSEVVFGAPQNPGEEGPATPEEVRAAVQGHLGAEVLDIDAMDCEVYGGGASASERRRVGGYMVVLCEVAGPEGVQRKRIEVDDDRRPFPERVITALGATARTNRNEGKYIWSDEGSR